MRKKIYILIMFILWAAWGMQAENLQEKSPPELFLTGKTINIDGDFKEWEGIPEFPVEMNPKGNRVDGTQDISVSVRFTYDAKNFYAAVKVQDDRMEFPNRSWRYGDGFYLTFVDSSEGEGVLFTTFGISRQDGEDEKVLVNRNGVYFPGESLKYMELETRKQKEGKAMFYETAIPWDYLIAFRPFFRDTLTVNLTYVDRDQNRREDILQLKPDTNYDTEATNLRKGMTFQLNNQPAEKVQIQSLMNATHFYHNEKIILKTGVLSPQEIKGWQLRVILSSGAFTLNESRELEIKKGMNHVSFPLPQKDYSSGSYDLSLGVLDNAGGLTYSQNHTFYVVNRGQLDKSWERFGKIKKEIEDKKEKEEIEKSFPAVAVRFEWIQGYMDTASDYAQFSPLVNWMEEKQILMNKLEQGRPALFPPGRIGRLAYRSDIDQTLQPYSVFIPPAYNPETPIPLFVTLHGSGVDEQTPIRYMVRLHQIYRSKNQVAPMIIMAPKARDLSGWYLGNSGRAVIESIRHLMTFYNIDRERIVLDGFSMGGYGAWRLGFLHPDLFRALIIRSGAIEPPPDVEGDNVLKLMDEPASLQIMVVHGEKDQAVPVEHARKAVERLKELDMDYQYIEVSGAGHGNYDRSQEIFRWLADALNLRMERRRIRR